MPPETPFQHVVRVAAMCVRGNWAPLAHAVWVRWHRLEHPVGEFVPEEDGNIHQYSGGPRLSAILRTLDIPRGSVAIDLGAGAGIAALTLSRHFSRVIGIELSPELVAVARRNIARMGVRSIELRCGDARTTGETLDPVTHVYMFNPFGVDVMRYVMEHLVASAARVPRPLTLIYLVPECHAVVEDAGFLLKRTWRFPAGDVYAVYERPAP